MNTRVFTVAVAGPNRINVYDATTGSLYKVITLDSNSQITSSPVVFGDGFSVVIKETGGTYNTTYGFPLCNIKNRSHISN